MINRCLNLIRGKFLSLCNYLMFVLCLFLTGYLACCLLLHENHELTLLLMNTIQKVDFPIMLLFDVYEMALQN